MKGAAGIRPFVGRLTSTAFHVRDPDDFRGRHACSRHTCALDLMVGHLDDDAPCYCSTRLGAREPFCLKRQPGEVVISEGGLGPGISRPDGWLTALQNARS